MAGPIASMEAMDAAHNAIRVMMNREMDRLGIDVGARLDEESPIGDFMATIALIVFKHGEQLAKLQEP